MEIITYTLRHSHESYPRGSLVPLLRFPNSCDFITPQILPLQMEPGLKSVLSHHSQAADYRQVASPSIIPAAA